jgi:hypothetical protein
MDFTGLKCWRCLLNGYGTPAGVLDENEKPICVFCTDGEPCPEAKRKPVGSPVADWNNYATRVNAKHSGDEKPAKSVEKQKRASAMGPQITNEEKKPMAMFEDRTCNHCVKSYTPSSPRQQFCSPACRQAAKSGGDLKVTLRSGKKKAAVGQPNRPNGAAEVVKDDLQPTPNVHTFTIHDKHVDRLLVALPIERKVEILRAELAL